VAKVVPITVAAGSQPESDFRLIGAYRERMRWDEDAFDPMTDEELAELGFDCLLEGNLVSSPAK
jgi:hypothetical protein